VTWDIFKFHVTNGARSTLATLKIFLVYLENNFQNQENLPKVESLCCVLLGNRTILMPNTTKHKNWVGNVVVCLASEWFCCQTQPNNSAVVEN
jgi:hypothetical protein